MTEPTQTPSGHPTPPVLNMIEALSAKCGTPLTPHRFTLPDGVRVGVDGADRDPPRVLVQATRAGGRVKSAHRNKVIADAFKLIWLRDAHFPDATLILALSPDLSHLLSQGSWLSAALEQRRIHTVLVGDDEGNFPRDISP
ncbi:hypothetical protein ACWGSK_17495 [Nocardiopsis sp. NPDC055551]